MLGGAVGEGSPGGEDLLTVTVVRDEHGYGMKVSGDNPVYVQSVKEHGAAWRAGLRAGDRILKVDSVPVHHHTHQQVVHMIRANPSTVLTVQQNLSRHKTPITAPVPVNQEKLRQLEVSKVHTMRLMLEKEQKYMRDLRNELLKVPDVRKQAQLDAAEQRCALLQHEIDNISVGQPEPVTPTTPTTPKLSRKDPEKNANMGFLSGLPRSLSNLTGQSLRNLRQARQKQETPLVRQNSDETHNLKHMLTSRNRIPTTCLDNTPPPLPPRSTERPKRNTMSPVSPLNPLNPMSPMNPSPQIKYKKPNPMHQSMPEDKFLKSSHSLEEEGPQPNSIALQMSYPLVNVPPPPLQNGIQTDNRNAVPILHVRSQSSPEHLDHDLPRTSASGIIPSEKETWMRGTPPPGTPPPPYLNPHPAHLQGNMHTSNQNAQPCIDSQRAIISMEEDDPPSDSSTHSGLFSNLRSVRESKARMAVLINWLLGERRCACASLVLVLTDAYRSATGVAPHTLRRWAYEIQSTFLMPDAILRLNGVDENMANEIENVLVKEYDKEELLRNVFRKARRHAKDELAKQLSEFQVKRQVGLSALYAPDDAVLLRCMQDKDQERTVVERLMCQRLSALASAGAGAGAGAACCANAASPDAHATLLSALTAAAMCLDCRPASVAAAVGGSRGSFLQRDKLYKQRLKQLTKQHPQPFVVRGHLLQAAAMTSLAHCHQCAQVITGLAPQAYVCANCRLRVHRACGRRVDEGCCINDADATHNRISRFMERMHAHAPPGQDSNDKKNRKTSGTTQFLNLERSFRKIEDEPPWDVTLSPSVLERRDESDESLYESADCHSDAISASDDALPRLSKTPTISKESLKLAITDEESEARTKKGHRKTMSLSNPIEIVKSLGDEWFDHTKKDVDKNSDKKKSRESLWSEEDRDSIHGSSIKLDQFRKTSKEDKANESRKSTTAEQPKRKTSKGSSVSALNFLRRKKTPTSMKAVEAVVEVVDGIVNTDEIMNFTKSFLEEEKRHTAICQSRPPVETDSDEDMPPSKVIGEHRRRLSRQTSRSKSKVRGKSQSVKVNTLRKSHSGTLKKGKKKSVKTPLAGRSRQTSIVEPSPLVKKKHSDSTKQNSWLFSSSRAEPRREGSTEENSVLDVDVDNNDNTLREPEKEQSWKSGARGVNRAESCRERDAPRRGKHRNASDPNRLTAHPNHDLEGTPTAPSGSSSSSSLSSRSNESNTVAAEHQGSQSDWSEEEDPLAAQWSDSLPQHIRDTIILSARIRKRQEVIHELIVSEGSHVRWLKVLGVDFLKPLERQPALLPPEELRALFPNLPGVRERHTKLYSELRQVRNEAVNHVVEIRQVADAMLNTLGESGYAPCLSKFCSGQRMALDSLRERRRKNKELHQFLAGREQLPRCGRLQLRDLLACVWQRLTKYQLLLESILKTTSEDGEDSDNVDDISQLKKALSVAKDVLHSVDTAIRTQENYHRLCTIQDKIEVRTLPEKCGTDFEELRKLDLTTHTLRLEGELALRTDTKKIRVLALMLEDSLVLLQREGEKFILRPLPQTGHNSYITPIIKWDKVLFRPNAAVRNTFFLMNINSIQMHELSANTAAEYANWVKHIQEARLAEARPVAAHAHARSADDTATVNVSRNPSDASEKSTSSAPADTCERERERDRISNESDRGRDRISNERERVRDRVSAERDENEKEVDKEKEDREEKTSGEKDGDDEKFRSPQTPAVGRISTHSGSPPPALQGAVTVRADPVHTARRVLSHHERLRRLDAAISHALLAKSAVVAELLGVPAHNYAHVAELAVADVMGQVDICGELNTSRETEAPDLHQLLLAAQAQANQLTEALSAAMSVSEATAIAARSGRCDGCRRRCDNHPDLENQDKSSDLSTNESRIVDASVAMGEIITDSETSFEMIPDYTQNGATEMPLEAHIFERDTSEFSELSSANGAALATRLAPLAGSLHAALSGALAALPRAHHERRTLRAELSAARDRADRAERRARADYGVTEEISPKGVDQSIQDQPSNGG